MSKKWILGLIILVHVISLFLPIFNGDSAMYAAVAKNIAFNNIMDILNNGVQGNWIDKPHLGFWITALSIKAFGNTNFAFKFPAFLSFLLLLRVLFLFVKRNYGAAIAYTSILIMSSVTHSFLATNDVRLDLYFITFFLISIYYFQLFIDENMSSNLIIASFFTACAIMTKGIFILIPIGAAVSFQYIFTNKISNFFSLKWVLSFIMIALFITPELYCLKRQFAQYQETEILGQKVSNYLQFFFWDSQFGRFGSNLGQLKDSGDITFYIHTFLWAFLPWTGLAFKGLFNITKPKKEFYSLGAGIILFIILSLSKTQLSHHILILLPFLSIFTAIGIHNGVVNKKNTVISIIHYIILVLLPFVANGIIYLFFNDFSIIFVLGSISYLILLLFQIKQKKCILIPTLTASIYIGLFLNLILYPTILHYQSGDKLAQYLRETNFTKEIYFINNHPSSTNFYADIKVVKTEPTIANAQSLKGKYIFTNEDFIHILQQNSILFDTIKQFEDYRTTVLKSNFINPETRYNSLEHQFLIKLK